MFKLSYLAGKLVYVHDNYSVLCGELDYLKGHCSVYADSSNGQGTVKRFPKSEILFIREANDGTYHIYLS